jgi:hypothetical protein
MRVPYSSFGINKKLLVNRYLTLLWKKFISPIYEI